MSSTPKSGSQWGASYRLIASERWRAQSAAMGSAVTEALVEYARPKPGMKVLDLASGTGEPAISLSGRVGPQGHVTASDLSAELLEIAASRAQQRGLTNFSVKKADAQDLPFPDQSFDLVTCRFGVMFFADLGKALREAHRVLKPGSRACFVVWGPFEQPYFATNMGVVLKHVGGTAIPPGGADPFRFARPGSLSAALHRAGFGPVEEKNETLPWTWPGSVEEVWEYIRSVTAPLRPLLDRVPEEKWDQINAEVHAAIQKYSDGDKINFGATVVLASGMKS